MNIFPKKNIIPIIIPSIPFYDKFNNKNNYIGMNPSMYINEIGEITILVRCINYQKYSDKKFILYEEKSNSIYYILNGNINENTNLSLDKFNFSLIDFNYNLPIYNTYWLGLEDIRFINEKKILVIVPELNINGNPSIFIAELENKKCIKNFKECLPNYIEKNWMPFSDNDNNFWVIYSLSPFIIKEIENDVKIEINLNYYLQKQLEGYHGSTNGISPENLPNERLFLIHINKEKTYHRWLLYNIENKIIKVSEEFVFFPNSYIEFTCSLCNYKNQIFISIGINDNQAFIIELEIDEILKYINIDFPTIITMIYDIRKLENNNIERNRKIESYLDFSKQFILQLPYPIIFFIEEENSDIYNIIYNTRKDLKLLDKTKFYFNSFQNTYFYKDLNILKNLQTQFYIMNGEKEHETPMYIILNNNKFDCIEKSIEINPFHSTHFLWMDIGINHVAENYDLIHDWIFNIPDKIKQLCINPYTENSSNKEHFQFIYHNMAGGLFSGSKENLMIYSRLFKEKTEEIYNDNWYQIDEAVMTIIQKENSDLFDLYYGDYKGIISNYISPIHNIDLIMKGSQKYLNINNTKEAYKILYYCIPFLKNNIYHGEIYNFLTQHFIVDYYHNNMLILDDIIYIINQLKESDYKDSIHNLININKYNIDFYLNKDEILFL